MTSMRRPDRVPLGDTPGQRSSPGAGHKPAASEVQAFRELIVDLTGLHFGDWRLSALETTLVARMLANGMVRAESYFRLLSDPGQNADELGQLLDQLTVNETYFFRYPAQFDFLRQIALPTLFERRGAERVPLRVWSIGCSTGEEPYSIAITALEEIGAAASEMIELLATDVSSVALARARHGEYGEKSVRLLDNEARAKYFRQAPEGRFAIRGLIKSLPLFRRSSVLDDVTRTFPAWDVIFCRNVLIYFGPVVVQRLLRGLSQCLRDDGYLFVGHSEIPPRDVFAPGGHEGLFVYQKRRERIQEPRKPIVAPPARPLPKADRDVPRAEPRPASRPDDATSPSVDRSETPETLYQRAVDAFDGEDYTRALDELDRLLRRCPRHTPGAILRANVYLAQGDHERSVQECQIATEVNPLAGEAYLLLGMNFLNLGKPAPAVAQLKRAVYCAPNCCVTQYYLAEAYRALEAWEDAARNYANALKDLPSTDENHVRRYIGGFSRSALKTSCEQLIAVCNASMVMRKRAAPQQT